MKLNLGLCTILSISLILLLGCSRYNCPVEKSIVTGTDKYDTFNHITFYARDSLIYPVKNGVVTEILIENDFISVTTSHFDGYTSKYLDMKKCSVELGDSVTTNTAIGVAYKNKMNDYFLDLLLIKPSGEIVFNPLCFKCKSLRSKSKIQKYLTRKYGN